MELFIIGIGVFFTVFSTIILGYISIATMVGPWIAPTLVLLGHTILSLYRPKDPKMPATQSIAWMQAIGAGGGIIATGVGFALPMLYFLDAPAFNSLLESPLTFSVFLAVLCLIAGGLGLLLARCWQNKFIDDTSLPFPVSNLTNVVIFSPSKGSQAKQLLSGIMGTITLCALRDGIGKIGGILSKTYYLFPSFLAKEAAFSIWPSLWAIGFTVGTTITTPLLVGLLAKYIVIFPLSQHANYLPFKLFDPMAPETFAIAFCSGLVLCEIIFSLPKYLKKWFKMAYSSTKQSTSIGRRMVQFFTAKFSAPKTPTFSWSFIIQTSITSLATYLFLSYFQFSLVSQLLLVIFTILATYSICQIGGKIGMVPFGRYSTFIVVPLLLLFKLTPLQATITCVFFDVCAATASDLLFDYKLGQINNLDSKRMYRYQWIGLIATTLVIGIFLWLLFTHLQLGSEGLFAQRSKAKALLLQSLYFDKYIVLLGIGFGWILKKCKVNPTMVFGGLIMPNSISIGIVLGSITSRLVPKPEQLQPLCAGALAAESLWILISIIGSL